ncbi:phosphate ABC transporter, inner membrane subunit PstA [Pyrolobus fumarii 1A]|uniref:Phosphate ABC transporter, inner membrane subunit PstA n=1 Tax=Pyrolobus fumarii (strain DSM 11204 / 1A) TaxID=694429 RepID=G0EF87_PYRF1|nr:ABC transporter permease subunit [Pyrolobus fumarii]AEM38130.1 phosphate ABC transporter, inner membrane subunit PstA [Pyrolobus fumarii 1A]
MRAFDSRRLRDRIFTLAVYAGGLLALLPLFAILAALLVNGLSVIAERGVEFFTSPAPTGIGPALYGTAILAASAMLIAVPLGVATALFLYEFPGSKLSPSLRVIVQSLVEIPTILTGLFIYLVLVEPLPPIRALYNALGLSSILPIGTYSGLAGAVALALVILPYIAVQAESVLRQVPQTYREAALALGATRQRAARIIASMAARGLATAAIIGFAKAAGETAPLLFTAGGGYRSYPGSPIDALTHPVGAVSLLIYDYARMPTPDRIATAWGAALVLTAITLALIILARFLVSERRL